MLPGSDPLIGTVLDGRYRIDALIGAGGMGRVYRARQLRVDRDVALKVLHPETLGEPSRIARFEREARIIAGLRDPHVVRLFDQGRGADGQLFIVCELLIGESLDRRLARGPLSVRQTLQWTRDICGALIEAHGSGVVHRDIKPANLFIEQLGHRDVIKLLDFGIARLADRTTTTRATVGTAAYMSPEQARDLDVDGRSDLYNLGLVAYECITGRRALTAEHVAALVMKQIVELPRPFAALDPPVTVTAEVEGLVFELLTKDRSLRPPDAAALAARLDALLGERPAASPAVGAGARPELAMAPTGSATRSVIPAVVASASVSDDPSSSRSSRPPPGMTPEVASRWRWVVAMLIVALIGGWLQRERLMRGFGVHAVDGSVDGPVERSRAPALDGPVAGAVARFDAGFDTIADADTSASSRDARPDNDPDVRDAIVVERPSRDARPPLRRRRKAPARAPAAAPADASEAPPAVEDVPDGFIRVYPAR